MSAHADIANRLGMITGWLRRRLDPEPLGWYEQQLAAIAADPAAGHLGRALGLAPRRLGKRDLALTAEESVHARALRPNFDGSDWSTDQAARVAFVLVGGAGTSTTFARYLDTLCDTAEINEAIAIYRGFALYPHGPSIQERAREAVRSSIRPVYEAIAHRNPYPAAYFDVSAWNQMVVKSFFLDSPLWPIQGLDRRANPALAAILLDLARERIAAGRPIGHELWRCVAPCGGSAGLAAMERVLECGTLRERLAVALSLASVDGSDATALRVVCGRQGLTERAVGLDWPMLAVMTD